MSTASTTPDESRLPADQQKAAERAHLNPDEPQLNAEAGTPHYGDFGKSGDTKQPQPRDGSNDNPDEFSEFRKDDDKNAGKPDQDVPGAYTTNSPNSNPTGQVGHVVQNRDPQAVRYAQGDTTGQNQKEEDNTRQAWAQDDERYAGGHAQASWQEQNDSEHDKN